AGTRTLRGSAAMAGRSPSAVAVARERDGSWLSLRAHYWCPGRGRCPLGVAAVAGRPDGPAVPAGEAPFPRPALDRDLASVYPVVVRPAQQDAVADRGRTVVFGPPEGVVDLAVFGRLVTARVLAVSIAGDHGLDLVGGEDSP